MQKQEIIKLLLDMFGSFDLSPKQTAKILGKSEQTLWRMRMGAIGPKYRQVGVSTNAPIRYPIHYLAEYLLNADIVITDGN